MGPVLLSLLTGLFSGILSSVAVLASLALFFRPKIVVSPVIVKQSAQPGGTVYLIKTINRGRREVVDVRVQLFIRTYRPVPGGRTGTRRYFRAMTTETLAIDGFHLNDADKKFSRTFRVHDDIEGIWSATANSELEFVMYSVDSLSNLGRVVTKTYTDKDRNIIEGEYYDGDTFEVREPTTGL